MSIIFDDKSDFIYLYEPIINRISEETIYIVSMELYFIVIHQKGKKKSYRENTLFSLYDTV